uniref:Secreted protein n=1 Tax=Knipowitschia caucasica TaxID=637954 RepID=A0AAV2MBU0_KNICA
MLHYLCVPTGGASPLAAAALRSVRRELLLCVHFYDAAFFPCSASPQANGQLPWITHQSRSHHLLFRLISAPLSPRQTRLPAHY